MFLDILTETQRIVSVPGVHGTLTQNHLSIIAPHFYPLPPPPTTAGKFLLFKILTLPNILLAYFQAETHFGIYGAQFDFP